MALVRPSPHEHNPPSEISTDNAEQLVLLEKPKKERLHQLPPPRHEFYLISAKLALFLISAISYLTFCFIVHYRHVPIGRSGVLGLPFHCEQYHSQATSLSLTAQRSLPVSTVSVITTMAILIVYVALWPIKGLVDEIRVGPTIYLLSTLPSIRGLFLQAEEFFRLMDTHPNGVPLDTVNAVSATTTGGFDIFMATIHRHCSPLLMSTLVISLVITATSSIAPAACELFPLPSRNRF
jgi:hypothetical protein